MPNPPSAVPGAGWAHGAGVCDCCPSAPLDDDDAWDELASAVAALVAACAQCEREDAAGGTHAVHPA